MPYRRWWWIVVALLALGLLAGCDTLTPKVTGQVTDADSGEPLAYGYIRVGDVIYSLDQNGRYALYLGAGEFTLQVWAPGHVTQAIPVTLTSTSLMQRKNVVLTSCKVALTAIDATTGRPVPEAAVRWGESTATTDAQGQAMLVMAARTELHIEGAGYSELVLPVEEVAPTSWNEQELTTLTVELRPRVLTGQILDVHTHEGVLGATVAVDDVSTQADAEGNYTLVYVPAQGTLTVSAEGYQDWPAESYSGQDDLYFYLEPWLAEVTVLDAESGLPVPEAQVSAGTATATTDEEGLAVVRVEPGAELTVDAEGYHGVTAAFTGGPLSVSVTPSRLVVVLTNSESGEPLADARVIAYAPSGEADVLYSDERGHVNIDDALQYDHLLVKQPGYDRVEVPVERMGRVDVSVTPFEARGVYIPFGLLVLPDKVEALLDMVAESEINMVTVDVKGDWSYLAWDSTNPIAQEIGAFYPDEIISLDDLVRMCHERDIYVVGRMVVFKDKILAENKPDWAVKKADGSLYVDGEGLYWVDPFKQDVRDYMIALAVEVAEMGFDEVQFDYVRFPSDGSTKYLEYEKEAVFDNRIALMSEFFTQAHDALETTSAFFSADLFGLVVWMDPDRDLGIGQRLDDVAPHVDYICPMLYPQTFGSGNLGYENPQLYPYEVVFRSVRRTKTRTETLVRAWLQHYSLGVDYDLPELLEQRKGAEDAGGAGWTYWNAAGKYNSDLFVPDPYAQVSDLPTPDDVD